MNVLHVALPFMYCIAVIETHCTSPWKPREDKCYKLLENQASFLEAIDACGEEDSVLAQPLTHHQLYYVLDHFVPKNDSVESGMWIGAMRVSVRNKDSSFIWLNGRTFNLKEWWCQGVRNEEPNNKGGIEYCVSLGNGHDYCQNMLFDLECDLKLRPLCEKHMNGSTGRMTLDESSLNFEIQNLYQKIDHLQAQKMLYSTRKCVLAVINLLLFLIVAVMYFIC